MNDPNNNFQGYPCSHGYPNQPCYPCQPGYPSQPSYPYQPTYSCQPGYPGQPMYPCQPNYPCQPGYPSYPCQPSYPYSPGYPIPPPGFYPSGFTYQPSIPYPIPGYPQPGVPCMPQPPPNVFPIPSLRPTPNMTLQVAVGTIKTCLDAFHADELGIYNILAHSTSKFREEIKNEFECAYRKTLIQEFKFMFDDNSRYFIQCLLHTGAELDAFILNKAMDFGFKKTPVIHILTTRSYDQITAIRSSYTKLFKEDLKRRIEMKTMGNFCKLMNFIMNNPRDAGPPNLLDINKQIEELKKGSFVKINAPDSLIPIFAKSSTSHIVALADLFEKNNGESLVKFLDGYNGEYEVALKSICEYILNPLSYYADFLKKCIDSSKIEGVIIIACTRCEIDLLSISNCYAAKYGKPPTQDIANKFGAKHPRIVDGILMLMGVK